MVDLGQEFKDAAEELVLEFAEPIGDSTYKRYVSEDYDPDTGITIFNYLTLSFAIAFDSSIEKFESKDLDSDPRLPSEYRTALIAGSIVGEPPTKSDLIIAADDGLTYSIQEIEYDMYGALYECLIYKVPNA